MQAHSFVRAKSLLTSISELHELERIKKLLWTYLQPWVCSELILTKVLWNFVGYNRLYLTEQGYLSNFDRIDERTKEKRRRTMTVQDRSLKASYKWLLKTSWNYMINWPQQVCFTRTALSRKRFLSRLCFKVGRQQRRRRPGGGRRRYLATISKRSSYSLSSTSSPSPSPSSLTATKTSTKMKEKQVFLKNQLRPSFEIFSTVTGN